MKSFNALCINPLVVIVSLAAQSAFAQPNLDLSGYDTNYFENFNSIFDIEGLQQWWTVRTDATATYEGNIAAFTWTGVNWGVSSPLFRNCASTTSNYGTNFIGTESTTIQTNCIDRAPAVRQTGTTGIDPGAAFVLRILNTTGKSKFRLSLDFLMLYVFTNSSTVWTVDYAIGNSPTEFIPKATYSDPGVFGATHMEIPFYSALNDKGSNVWIRIVALDKSTGSGNRDTFGIDNVSLTWSNGVAAPSEPTIITQPQSRTNVAQTTATFTVEADSIETMSYQWQKNGYDMYEGGNIWGVNASTLIISNVLYNNQADYTVIISNNSGSTTSQVARLTVIDPAIATQPMNRTNVAGDTADFYATAAGTTAFSYQWYHDNTKITGAVSNFLDVTNVVATNQGNYFVVVKNDYGSVTSSVAYLAVQPTPAHRIARWNFNDTNSFPATAPLPSEGTGTAALVGNTTAIFASGTFSDPAYVAGITNFGWNTSDYPSQSTSNLEAGVEFRSSTAGYQDILLTWEQRHSTRASKYTRLQYTTDGVNFSNRDVFDMFVTNGSFVFCAADLSSIPGVNNNSNFAFRVVSEFESSATGSGSTNYIPTFGTTYSGAQGTIRFDLMSVYGNTYVPVFPIPLNLARFGTNVVLSWTNPAFALQSAPAATGTFTNITGATSPYTTPITSSRKFYRLIW